MTAVERKGYGGSKLTAERKKIREANRRETNCERVAAEGRREEATKKRKTWFEVARGRLSHLHRCPFVFH